jgi:radical SAM-linked protein
VGRQIFLGHLDRMKNLSRGLRRAGLVVEYTQGFHPKPKLEAAPPLPLGTAGLAEIVDLWLVDPPDDEEIAARLARSFPPEMELVTARRLDGGAQKLGKAIRAAEYVALIDAARADVAKAVSGLLLAEALEVERTRKGVPVTFDARPYLLEAEVLDGPWDGPGGMGAGRVAVRLVILVPPSGGARPIDLLRPVLGEAAEGAWLIRTRWLLNDD